MNEGLGKKIWVFPDAELPPPGDSLLKGHEALIVLNTATEKQAHIGITFYFADAEPVTTGPVVVDAQRVRCIRLDRVEEVGLRIPLETQYAFKVESDVPVVAQYGRLDSRQANLAYYTTMGFTE